MRVTDQEITEAIEKTDSPFVTNLYHNLKKAREALADARRAALEEAARDVEAIATAMLDGHDRRILLGAASNIRALVKP